MSDDPLSDRLKKELQPELDRMRAEHDRRMRLIAQMPEPTEAQKQAIAEMNSPEGWQSAIAEVMADATRKRRRIWPLVMAVVVLIAAAAAAFILAR
jgi:hypothetical protein